jgi:hypothetical protein
MRAVMQKKDDTHVKESPAHLIGVTEAVSIATAAVATGIQTRFAIGRRMGSNFEEMAAQVGSKAHSIQQDLLGKLSALSDDPAEHTKEFAVKVREIYKTHETNVKAYWADRNITGLGAKLKSFKSHQRLEVLFGSIAVFTVSLGVAIGFTKSDQVKEFFTRHGHPSAEPQVQL